MENTTLDDILRNASTIIISEAGDGLVPSKINLN